MRERRRPSPALVISLIALFVSAGGTGYAALRITGKDVKNSSLTGADVKNNSLTARDIRSLGPSDFKAGSLPRGPKGERGEIGPAGAPAPPPETVQAVRPPSSPTNCDGAEKPIGEFCGLGAGAAPWANLGGGYQAAGFYKDGAGLVHLQGTVNAGGPAVASVHQDVFYLPVGYRPSATRSFAVNIGGVLGFVEIRSNGMVFSSDVPATPSLSFDGISFRP